MLDLLSIIIKCEKFWKLFYAKQIQSYSTYKGEKYFWGKKKTFLSHNFDAGNFPATIYFYLKLQECKCFSSCYISYFLQIYYICIYIYVPSICFSVGVAVSLGSCQINAMGALPWVNYQHLQCRLNRTIATNFHIVIIHRWIHNYLNIWKAIPGCLSASRCVCHNFFDHHQRRPHLHPRHIFWPKAA